MIIDQQSYLKHYGVAGMRWGVRKDGKSVRKQAKKDQVAKLQAKGLSKRQAKATSRAQNIVDAQKMTATGRQGKISLGQQAVNRMVSNNSLSLSTVLKHPLSSQKAAQTELAKWADIQKQINSGEKKATELLNRKLAGVMVSELNFSLDK